MCIVHRMTFRARPRRAAQLGHCLARLDGLGAEGLGCLELRIFPLAGDALGWQVEGAFARGAGRSPTLGIGRGRRRRPDRQPRMRAGAAATSGLRRWPCPRRAERGRQRRGLPL